MRSYGKLLDVAAGIISLGAGAYLIGTNAASANSIFNPLLHGIGAYILARGLWMLTHAGKQEDLIDRLDRLIDDGE